MPHQCVRCSKIYDDGSKEILKGCLSCGGKFFFFVKKESLEQVKEATSQLSVEDKERIEKDVMDIIGLEEDKPIILDLASVNILKPGKFELDLVRLFRGEPMVYRLEEGKYIIDIAETFKNVKKSLSEK
ncbi:MAG TPA: Zn-ribbon containing protein [Candidatus Nanoarchaeia archaeon]|nr:Zn-ribbon containing protein [Candidatus Nanoarchaeia archaeon]